MNLGNDSKFRFDSMLNNSPKKQSDLNKDFSKNDISYKKNIFEQSTVLELDFGENNQVKRFELC